MLVAVVVTLLDRSILSYGWILAGVLLGGTIGALRLRASDDRHAADGRPAQQLVAAPLWPWPWPAFSPQRAHRRRRNHRPASHRPDHYWSARSP
ncbi:hypothetical protein DSL92_03660 [Billgrantia gudaonensis]|uniref:Uncharacterized protein n=1 Tax=Billgrantia gudaonensis TaxID=376427 RepID=A0A3S0NHI7_9GAMM|nr:hypothetical protein DSL92_03660 [Halomonas gudaonensis]